MYHFNDTHWYKQFLQVSQVESTVSKFGLALYLPSASVSSIFHDAIILNFLFNSLLYLLVSWAWWDWPLTWLTNHCPSVLRHCWLGYHIWSDRWCVEWDVKPYCIIRTVDRVATEPLSNSNQSAIFHYRPYTQVIATELWSADQKPRRQWHWQAACSRCTGYPGQRHNVARSRELEAR